MVSYKSSLLHSIHCSVHQSTEFESVDMLHFPKCYSWFSHASHIIFTCKSHVSHASLCVLISTSSCSPPFPCQFKLECEVHHVPSSTGQQKCTRNHQRVSNSQCVYQQCVLWCGCTYVCMCVVFSGFSVTVL